MTYEPWLRGEPGFRQEPDFRADNGLSATYQPGGYAGTDSGLTLPGSSRATPDNLVADPLDDARGGDLGPDRLLVHFAWELVLLIGIAAVGYLLLSRHREQLTGDNMRDLLVYAGALSMLAVGAGLSLRTGAPNLAVGSIATSGGIFFAINGDQGFVSAAGTTILLCLAVGAGIGLLVVGLHVPGWAASLGVGFALAAWTGLHRGPVRVLAWHDPRPDASYIFGVAAALAVVGALLGAVRPIRAAIGRFRPSADPAWRRGFVAALLTLVTLAFSGLFAGAAGVLLALRGGGTVQPDNSILLTGLALGVALLGGTSAFGRRGGVFGTLLAAILLSLVMRYGGAGHPGFPAYLVAGGAVLIGVAVTRMVETFGGPGYEDDTGGERGGDVANQPGGWPAPAAAAPTQPKTGGWSSLLAPRPAADLFGRALTRGSGASAP